MGATLVLLRHGESQWNLENRFTGWTDVDLSAHGVEEAHRAGLVLAAGGFHFDIGFTSVLKRAIHTLWTVLDETDLAWIPVERHWWLNERHYGALQGLNKAETADQYGKEKVHAWRRSFGVRPPALMDDDPRHPRFDPRYAHLEASQLPATESLQDTLQRVMPRWHETVTPYLENGASVLVVAHGNSLRALVKHLDGLSDEEIAGREIPTGVPLLYRFGQGMQVQLRQELVS